MNILHLLRQPYPIETSVRERLLIAVAISLFVPLFLGIFQPFGISRIESSILWFVAGYGAVTFVASLMNSFLLPFLLPAFFSDGRWSVGKHLGFMLWYILTVASGNLFYTYAQGYTVLSLSSFVGFLLATAAVGFFPVSFFTLLSYSRSQRHYQMEAMHLDMVVHEHNEKEHLETEQKQEDVKEEKEEEQEQKGTQHIVILYDEEKREALRLEAATLLYIKAADNYVEVVHSTPTPTLIRTTLKRIEETTLPEEWYRCHRSYMVNLSKVQHVSGNSQGLRLLITDDLPLIPVARAKSKELRDKLASLNI